MKVAIRVDASQAIGTGHVRRCLALAYALAGCGAELLFVTRDLGVDTREIVAPFALRELAAPTGEMPASAVPHAAWAQVSAAQDVQDSIAALGDWAPDWLVVDSYAFDAEWHGAMRAALGCRIAVLDDLADRALAADLVVDHNYDADHRAKYAGRIAPGGTLLAGSDFALLGPAFAEAPRYVPRDAVESIGIFVGGVDQGSISTLALEAIDATGFDGTVEIVSTSANPNLEQLCARVAQRRNTKLTTDLPDLAAFFARHDIQIGAGGGATWERCCIGSPTLLLVVAENQLAVVPGLAAEGVIVTPAPLGTLAPEAMAETLANLIADAGLRWTLSERTRALVDGLGARRVALRMLASSVTVRPATTDDAGRMHRWRNDPATRAVSRQAEAINWDSHITWLDRTLADPARTLMIGMVGQVPVGVIRFDTLDEGSAEVSLYLDPALVGLGLGKAMLLAGEAAVGSREVLAEVLDGNIGSARLFESAGYQRVDTNHWIKPATGRTQANRDQ